MDKGIREIKRKLQIESLESLATRLLERHAHEADPINQTGAGRSMHELTDQEVKRLLDERRLADASKRALEGLMDILTKLYRVADANLDDNDRDILNNSIIKETRALARSSRNSRPN